MSDSIGTRTSPGDAAQQRPAVWFYEQAGDRQGPAEVARMRALLDAGTLNARSLVWRQGMGAWAPLGDTELRHLLSEPPELPARARRGLAWPWTLGVWLLLVALVAVKSAGGSPASAFLLVELVLVILSVYLVARGPWNARLSGVLVFALSITQVFDRFPVLMHHLFG